MSLSHTHDKNSALHIERKSIRDIVRRHEADRGSGRHQRRAQARRMKKKVETGTSTSFDVTEYYCVYACPCAYGFYRRAGRKNFSLAASHRKSSWRQKSSLLAAPVPREIIAAGIARRRATLHSQGLDAPLVHLFLCRAAVHCIHHRSTTSASRATFWHSFIKSILRSKIYTLPLEKHCSRRIGSNSRPRVRTRGER